THIPQSAPQTGHVNPLVLLGACDRFRLASPATGTEPAPPAETTAGEAVQTTLTLGWLLSELQACDAAAARNRELAAAYRAQGRSIEAAHIDAQTGACAWRPDPQRMPGIDLLRAYVLASWGEELTAETCRRVIGQLVLTGRPPLTATQAEGLTLEEA